MHVLTLLHSILLSSVRNKPNLRTKIKKGMIVVCFTLKMEHNWYLYSCFCGFSHIAMQWNFFRSITIKTICTGANLPFFLKLLWLNQTLFKFPQWTRKHFFISLEVSFRRYISDVRPRMLVCLHNAIPAYSARICSFSKNFPGCRTK